MRKLGRKIAHRVQLMKNLTTSIILYENVTTTQAKAKDARIMVEKIINLGKKQTLDSRRALLAYLNDKKAVAKVIEELAPRFKDKVGGYMNMYNLGPRVGDGAARIMIKMIGAREKTTKKNESDVHTEEAAPTSNKSESEKSVKESKNVKTTVKEKK